MVDIYGLSDVGCIRELNEDCFCIHGYEGDSNKGFCVLADGMGGHNAGEVASQNAVRIIDEKLSKILNGEIKEKIPKALTESVDKANDRVYKMSVESTEHRGMGTTVVIAYTEDETVYIANVGDSRAYVIDDKIHQLTCDHSVVEEFVKSGTITRDEARVHPQRNIITRAVGTEPTIETDIFEYEYKHGDVMILCSDGLSSMLEDRLIYEIVKSEETSENTVCSLVKAAKMSGGLDNITVICIRF